MSDLAFILLKSMNVSVSAETSLMIYRISFQHAITSLRFLIYSYLNVGEISNVQWNRICPWSCLFTHGDRRWVYILNINIRRAAVNVEKPDETEGSEDA